MLNFLRHLFRQPVKVTIVPRDPMRLTMEEWRSQPDMIKAATVELQRPVLRQMLDVMRTSHLSRYTATGTVEDKAAHLCRCEGYLSAMNDFEALGKYEQPKTEVESTFEPPEENET